GLDRGDGAQALARRDPRPPRARHDAEERLHHGDVGAVLVVRTGVDRAWLPARLAQAGLPPADVDAPGGAVHHHVGLALRREAPAEVDAPDQSLRDLHHERGRVLDLDALGPLELSRQDAGDRTEEERDDVEGVAAVVDDDPAARDAAPGV